MNTAPQSPETNPDILPDQKLPEKDTVLPAVLHQAYRDAINALDALEGLNQRLRAPLKSLEPLIDADLNGTTLQAVQSLPPGLTGYARDKICAAALGDPEDGSPGTTPIERLQRLTAGMRELALTIIHEANLLGLQTEHLRDTITSLTVPAQPAAK